MSKKYLRKSEFRYNTGPKVVRPDGKGHPTYISARYKNKYKFNVITHSDTFFDEPTHHLTVEPNRNKKKKLKKLYFQIGFTVKCLFHMKTDQFFRI